MAGSMLATLLAPTRPTGRVRPVSVLLIRTLDTACRLARRLTDTRGHLRLLTVPPDRMALALHLTEAAGEALACTKARLTRRPTTVARQATAAAATTVS